MFKKTLWLLSAWIFSALALLALAGGLSVGQLPAQAATVPAPQSCVEVSADIAANITWTQPCYRVQTTTVTVLPTATLTIAPPPGGTRVEFAPNARLQVLGRLHALGAAATPITFTSMAVNPARCDWVGIILGTGSTQNRIEHALIEYACTGIDVNGILNVADGNHILSNTLRFNGGPDARNGAIGGDIDYSTIRNNVIYSSSNGIAINEAGYNTIADNHIFDIDRYGIHLMQGGVGGGTYNNITGNEIHHCLSGAVRLEVGTFNVLADNVIHHNLNGAIELYDQALVSVNGNHVHSNGGGSGYQAAIHLTGSSTRLEALRDNVVHDAHNDALHLAAGTLALQPLTGNALCSVPAFELRNATGTTLAAPRNWWGTNTPLPGSLSGAADIDPWLLLEVEVTPPTLPAVPGATAIVRVRLTDGAGNTVPAAAREVRLASSAGSLPTAVTLNAAGEQEATLTLAALPAGDVVVVSATAFCDYTAVATLTLERTNLAVAKTTAITQALAGEPVTYRLHYTNTSAITATDVRLTDTLPVGMVWTGDGSAAQGWTRVMTAPPVWTRAALPPGAGSFVMTATLAPPTCGQNLVNAIAIDTATAEITTTDNVAQAPPVSVICPAVQIAKTGVLSPTGGGVIYTFNVTNTGSLNSPPLALDAVFDVGDGWPGLGDLTAAAQSGGCTPLATGAACVFSVTYTLPSGGAPPLTNTVTITYHPQGHTASITATATHAMAVGVDLVVVKDDNVGPTTPFGFLSDEKERLLARNAPQNVTQHREFIYEGDLITYTISACNAYAIPASNVVLTEYIPAYTTYVEREYGWVQTEAGVYTLSLGTLLPSECKLTYMVVRADEVLPENVVNLINQVCVHSAEPELNPVDNCNYEDTPVRRLSLRVSKSAPVCVGPGDYFYYTPRYTNTNQMTGFLNVPMTDTLPSYVTYAGATPGDWTCSAGTCRTTLPSVPANTSATGPQLPVRLSPTFPYTTQSAITNTIEISGGARFTHTLVVDIGPDIAVVKNDNVGPLPQPQRLAWQRVAQQVYGSYITLNLPAQREYVRPGDLITYTLLYVNTGVGAARDVVLTEYLPEYTVYYGGGWEYAGGNRYTVNLGTLQPGQGGERVFVVRVIEDFPLNVDRVLNVARITTSDPECDLSNNTTNDDTPVRTDTLLYIAARDSNRVEVYDTMNFEYLGSFAAGPWPFGMVAYDGLLYVGNFESGIRASQVTVIDLATWRVVKTIEVGFHPAHLTAYNGRIYVTNHSGGESLTVIDHATLEVVARLRLDLPEVEDYGFFGITADTLRGRILTTKRYMGAIGLWSITPQVDSTFALAREVNSGAQHPYATLYNPTTDRVYVAYPNQNEVRAYDAETFALWHIFGTEEQDPYDPGVGGHGLAAHGACTYVSNYRGESVSVLAEGPCYSVAGAAQSASVSGLEHAVYLPLVLRQSRAYPYVTHIPVEGWPKGLASGRGIVIVTLADQNRFAVIDVRTQTVTRYVETEGEHPHTAVIVYNAPPKPAP